MKKIVKKWEGGVKKHGRIGKAMGVQIDKWIQRDEEQAKEAREAEELRQRLEHERLAKEAEERDRLEQEQIRKALELSKKAEEELAAQKLGKEELEQLKLAEKLSKESFEKLQRDKIIDFLRRSDDISDDAAFPALDIVQRWESTNEELIEKLHSFGDEALDKFLSGVEIVGDSSF